jgi:SAM-dependent methyltransferase
MALLGGNLGYRVLKRLSDGSNNGLCDGSAYVGRNKLEVLLGASFWNEIAGKVVLDFGCGDGGNAVEVAKHGAKRVIGLDIRESVLQRARTIAKDAGVEGKCSFVTHTEEKADVILSIDAFEHFEDLAGILRTMRRLVKDDGCVIAAFGPTWYHPLGGHLFSVFPWSHLIFTEEALIRWRSDFKNDGATRFGEIEGGLNQLTIREFQKLVSESDFRLQEFEPVPIRRLRPIANKFTQEFTTAIVRCKLYPKEGSA